MAFENDTPHFNAEPRIDAVKGHWLLSPKHRTRIGYWGQKFKRRTSGQSEKRIESDDLPKVNWLRRLLLAIALCSALGWLLFLIIKAGFGTGIV